MRYSTASLVWLLLLLASAQAQEPARDAVLQGKQQQAGAAFRALQQAQYEAKLAEQDFLNAQDAHGAAQKLVDERKRQLDAAKKTLDAAQARAARARKAYDEALSAVEQVFPKAPAK
jgi:hypothetical protein